MPGEGGDPHRALIAFRPERGRGDVAQGFAGAGARLGEDQIGLSHRLTRGEGGGGGGGVIGLTGALLGALAQHLRQPMAGLGGGHRMGGGRRRRGFVFPFGQRFPHPHRIGIARIVGLAEGGEHEFRPGPTSQPHARGNGGGVFLAAQITSGEDVREQGCGNIGQNAGHRVARRRFDIQRQGKPQRRRGHGLRRLGKGEKFQQIQARHGANAEALERRRRMHQQRQRPGAQDFRRLGDLHVLQFAIDSQQLRAADHGDNGRGMGQHEGGQNGHGIPFARSRPDSRGD